MYFTFGGKKVFQPLLPSLPTELLAFYYRQLVSGNTAVPLKSETTFTAFPTTLKIVQILTKFLLLLLLPARTRASTGRTPPTWSSGTTARVCTFRPASSSPPARSTSRGSRSTTSAARWSSARGRTTAFRWVNFRKFGKNVTVSVTNFFKRSLMKFSLQEKHNWKYR